MFLALSSYPLDDFVNQTLTISVHEPLVTRGTPRYLIGRVAMEKGVSSTMSSFSSSVNPEKTIRHLSNLSKLKCNPVKATKTSSTSTRQRTESTLHPSERGTNHMSNISEYSFVFYNANGT